MTRATRVFYIVLALALVSVSFAALVPHHDTEDARCVVCKVGSQPFEQAQAASATAVDAPLLRSLLAEHEPSHFLALASDNASRAPPA